ncbi:hypothetical protein ACHAP5_008604 [Fusarium lateritium]
MSVLFVLIYILRGSTIRKSVSKRRIEEDADFLELFSLILVGPQITAFKAEISTALEQGIQLEWEDVYDVINPYGDRRGRIFNSVWIFDLNKGLLFLRKQDCVYLAPLELVFQRLLTLDDFHQPNPETQINEKPQTLPEPYWVPKMDISPRKRSFLSRMLVDFGYTWRHVLRRPMNNATFMRLAYATVWISTMQFEIHERQGFEHLAGQCGPFAGMGFTERSIVQVGSTWFVFIQDIQEGIEMARDHARSYQQFNKPMASAVTYAVLSLRQITLCKMVRGQLVWTRPEILFGESPSDTAIDMLVWASDTLTTEPVPSRIHSLPLEIQDNILYCAATSSVSAGRLGCILGLGSPFTWTESGLKIKIQERRRNRVEESPLESQIMIHGVMSGLSYKREPMPSTIRFWVDDLPRLQSGLHACLQTTSMD